MKKIILILVTMVLSTGVLLSEGSKEAVKKSQQSGPIAIWTFINKDEAAIIKDEIIPESKTGVAVDFVLIPSGEYEQKLRIALNSGTAPDIFYVDGVYTANYAYNGALMSLDKYWDRADFEDYVQSSQDKCQLKGSIYAASLYETSCVLFYNKDHFSKAGLTSAVTAVKDAWTYDQLVDAAKKLTITDPKGSTVQFGLLPGMSSPDVGNEGATFTDLLWLWNHGGEVTDPQMKTAIGYFDGEKSKTALRSYAELFQTLKVSPLESVTQGFQTGKISMMIHNISNSSGFTRNYPGLNYGVMPVPVGERAYSTSGGWNIAISAQCKNPDRAWKVLSALTGKEGHASFCDRLNYMPSRKSTLASVKKFQEYPLSVGIELLKSNPRARPITPAYAEISPLIAEAFNAAAFGENVDKVAADAAKKIDKILKKYGN